MTGFEPAVADAAIKGLAGVVIKTVWEGGGKFLGLIGGNLSDGTKQLVFNALRQYVQNYNQRHGILKCWECGSL
jgi:hypothetical protein